MSEVKIGKTWLDDKLKDYWTHVAKLRHSKQFIRGYSSKMSYQLLSLTRKQVRILTMFLTGHAFFNKHLKKMGLVNDDKCRKCGDIQETAEHLLCDYESLAFKRKSIFGQPELEPSDFMKFPLKKILKFIKSMNIVFEL